MGIEAKGALEGSLNYSEIEGEINNGIEKIYPELEDLEVTPSTEEQNFKSRKYGYDKVKVKAIESETLTISPTKLPQTHTGIYDTVNVNGSYDLEAENIVRGKTIFGVAGTFDGVDTSDANATSSDIKMSKTAYVNGMKVTGNFNGVDTSDATATAGDIKMGKTAYVDNEKVIGTYEGIIPTGTKSITTNGIHDVTQYAEANVNVPAPSPNLQSKSVTITENTTTNIGADAGYDGLSSVAVTTNVSGGGGNKNAKVNTQFTSTNNTLLLNIVELPDIDFSDFETINSIFSGAKNLTTIGNITGTEDVLDMGSLFSNCNSLESSISIDTSSCEDIANMFYNCYALTSITLLNMGNVNSAQSAFFNCRALTSFPSIDTSNIKNMGSMIRGCSKLTDASSIDTSSATSATYLFADCTELVTVPVMDWSKMTGATALSNMFNNCTKLSDTSLNNIMASCLTATSYTGTKTLSRLGVNIVLRNRCPDLSNWDAFVAAGWGK